ncbi:glycosyltransferase family 39 protein [Actinocorallia longicatena]|uniref:Glycosyltransferase family 39 protein n=1 Tax=Actinocorallia longicatena TaxID=111803 RepID=A0ABP6QJA7_9ACTN
MRKSRTPWISPLLAAALALAIAGWRIDAPSLWRDEAVTADLTGRSFPDMVRTLAHIDAVHGFYYLLMRLPAALFTGHEWLLRLPSALAAAATAALTVLLARHLAAPSPDEADPDGMGPDGMGPDGTGPNGADPARTGPWWTGSERLGLTAGVLVAISPIMSRYGQEARQYTLVAALAVLATYLLVRAGSRRGWTWYALAVAALGFTHLFALFLLPAHLATVLLERRPWRPWATATGLALAPVAVLAVVALRQSYQISWITSPTGGDVWHLLGSLSLVTVLVLPAGILLALALWKWSPLTATALPWLVLPPGLLLAISLVSPIYVERYVLYCVPAACLLLAAGLDRLPWQAALPLVLVAAVLTVPRQLQIRDPHKARIDDLRRLAAVLRAHEREGDAVVYTDPRFRPVTATYPEAFAPLDDVLLARTPDAAADLKGRELPRSAHATALAGTSRVWLIHNTLAFLPGSDSGARAKRRLLNSPAFRRLGGWRYHGGTVTLFERVAVPSRVEMSAPVPVPKSSQ